MPIANDSDWGARVMRRLRRFWQALRTLAGDDAYERYKRITLHVTGANPCSTRARFICSSNGRNGTV